MLPADIQAQSFIQAYSRDAEYLYSMARDLWAPVEMDSLGIEQSGLSEEQMHSRLREAVLLLDAAVRLDPRHAMAWRDLVVLYTLPGIDDPGRATEALTAFSEIKPNESGTIDLWIRYMVDRLPERRKREYLLEKNISTLSYYPWVQSEVLTQLGTMAIEKGDTTAAFEYFQQAFSVNRYNFAALAQLLELSDTIEETVSPPLTPADAAARAGEQTQRQLQTILLWRTQLKCDPFNLDAALNLIEAMETAGAFEPAKKFYEHAYRLLEMVPEGQAIRQDLQIKHMIKLYNHNDYRACIDMAESILSRTPDDLLVNGIQARAMDKIGLDAEADAIMQQSVNKTIARLDAAGEQDELRLTTELAWFYCFIKISDPDPAAALKFARRAHDLAPDDPQNAAVLAYALVLNQQWQPAESLLEKAPADDPITILARTELHLHRNETARAREKLESVNLHQTGILYEKFQNKLKSTLLSDGQPPAGEQTTTAEAESSSPEQYITRYLQDNFDDGELGLPFAPEEFLDFQIRVKTDNFRYGDPVMVELQMSNISPTTLIFGPGSFLDPHVLITAEIQPVRSLTDRATDRPDETPNEIPVCYRYLSSRRQLAGGRNMSLSESLYIGYIRDILEDHPQQNYRITLRMYIDPVLDEQGQISGRFPSLQPDPLVIFRKDFDPTLNRLKVHQRFLTTGSDDERCRSLLLLGGLLREARSARRDQIPYAVRPFDRSEVRNWVESSLTASSPRVRGWGAYALRDLPIAAESETINELAALLSDDNWFVRFQTCRTLQPVVDLTEYLQWAVKVDPADIVKRQAAFYLDQPWQIMDIPLDIPEETDTDTAPAGP